MQRQYVLVQLHDKGKIQVPEGSPTHQKAVKQIQGWHVVGEPYTPQRSGPGGQPQSQKKSPAVVAPATNRPAAERAVGKGERLNQSIPVPPFDANKVLEPIRSPKRFDNVESPAATETAESNTGTADHLNIKESNPAANERPPVVAPSKGKPGPKPKNQ